MSKIAVVITGHVRRNYIANLRSVIDLLSNTYGRNMDIYACIWNKTELGVDVENNGIFGKDITVKFLDSDEYKRTKPKYTADYNRIHSINHILSLSKKQIFAQFMDKSKAEERGTHCGFAPEAMEYWMNRLRDQYYPLSKAFRLIPNPQSYDLVFRLRTDFGLIKPIKIRQEVINTNDIVMINGYDCFQYGNPEVMAKYFDLHDHLYLYEDNYCKLNQYGYDTFNSENLLRHYMSGLSSISPYSTIIEEDLVEGQDFVLGR